MMKKINPFMRRKARAFIVFSVAEDAVVSCPWAIFAVNSAAAKTAIRRDLLTGRLLGRAS
ncbi:MAG: hypothetical protein AABZ10_02965 [Nitrospirota bacterium]